MRGLTLRVRLYITENGHTSVGMRRREDAKEERSRGHHLGEMLHVIQMRSLLDKISHVI